MGKAKNSFPGNNAQKGNHGYADKSGSFQGLVNWHLAAQVDSQKGYHTSAAKLGQIKPKPKS